MFTLSAVSAALSALLSLLQLFSYSAVLAAIKYLPMFVVGQVVLLRKFRV